MTEPAIGSYYSAEAARYGDVPYTVYNEYLKDFLLDKWTRPGDVCLDVGFANGIHLIPLAKKVRRVAGVDVSEGMVTEGRKRVESHRLSNVELRLGDAARLPFDDASFDLVYSYSTLIFVRDIIDAFREIARVLKPGGKAILDVSGRYNLSIWHWGRYYKPKGVYPLQGFSLKKLHAIFQGLGLRILETHGSGILDQYKYLPVLHRFAFIDKIIHASPRRPDVDYMVSQWLPGLANRWYFVLEKGGPSI